MGADDKTSERLKHKVDSALEYLSHCRCRTFRFDVGIVPPDLTKQEQGVQTLALRVLAQFFAGELDPVTCGPGCRCARSGVLKTEKNPRRKTSGRAKRGKRR